MAQTTNILQEQTTAVASCNARRAQGSLARGLRLGLVVLFLNALAVSADDNVDRGPATKTPARGSSGKIVVSSVKPRSNDSSSVVKYGLTRRDYDRIVSAIPVINTAIPVRECRKEAIAGDRTVKLRLIGTVPAFHDAHGIKMARGRFLLNKDLKRLNNVAVLHLEAAQRLFPGEDAVGKSIRIGRNYFLVVGVVAEGDSPIEKSTPGRERAENLNVYLPISTMRSRLGDTETTVQSGTIEIERFELSRIEITVKNRADVAKTAAAVRRLLQRLHEKSDYSITVPK